MIRTSYRYFGDPTWTDTLEIPRAGDFPRIVANVALETERWRAVWPSANAHLGRVCWLKHDRNHRAATTPVTPRWIVLQIDRESRRAGKGGVLTACDACDRPLIDKPRETCCDAAGHQECVTPEQHINHMNVAPATLALIRAAVRP